MKKFFYKLSILIVVISLFCSLLIVTSGCKKVEKKAIIMLPGIMGSVLYDADTNEPLWLVNSLGSDFPIALNNILSNIDKIMLDENGESDYNLRPANMNDTEGFYSILQLFKPLYNQLVEQYSNEYDIIIWQYDWRVSCEESSAKLETYINDEGYEKVIFVTHSMGGNVVSDYIARSETNKAKIELFVPVCAPFFGSMQAYDFLYEGMLAQYGFATITKELGMNLPSVYLLSPSSNLLNAPEYSEGESMIYLDNIALSYDEINTFFLNQDFAKKQDDTLKYAFANKESYLAKQMVELNGEMVHISRTINTKYVQGTGLNTIKSFNIKTSDNTVNSITYTDGDCVVSIYSGTAGMDLSSPDVFLIDGPDHITIMEYDETVSTVMSIVADYIGK